MHSCGESCDDCEFSEMTRINARTEREVLIRLLCSVDDEDARIEVSQRLLRVYNIWSL